MSFHLLALIGLLGQEVHDIITGLHHTTAMMVRMVAYQIRLNEMDGDRHDDGYPIMERRKTFHVTSM